MIAATTCPTPGIAPITPPNAVERKIVRKQGLRSAHRNRSPSGRVLAPATIELSLRSMASKISGMANSPITSGSKSIPAWSAWKPKSKRTIAPIGSCPIIARSAPISSISIFLKKFPELVTTMISRLKMRMAAISGGPIIRAIIAMGPIIATVANDERKSPMAEATSAISRALRDCPFRVRAGPSKVVAMAAPVPGMLTRIAGMLPPKMPPL